jgi:hypothetical protein
MALFDQKMSTVPILRQMPFESKTLFRVAEPVGID